MVLPIANRELRVAARKRSTTYYRVGAAVIALIIGGGALLLESVLGRAGGGTIGRGLFSLLTWLSLAATFTSGLFLTADCLSEEKRDGTLGFLFLTDLRGYDVVLGKLLSTSLQGIYGLLAILPIVGVTLVLGGITGAQFWKTAVALVTALFVSLATGLFASSFHRDSQHATMTTLLLLVLLAGAGPAIDAIRAEALNAPFQPVLSVSSPVYLFWAANAWGRIPYWTSLIVNQALGWAFFALACWLVRLTWQDRPRSQGTKLRRWKLGSSAHARQRLLDLNPVVWLNCRERRQSLLVWLMATINVFGFLVAVIAAASNSFGMSGTGLTLSWMAWSYLEGLTLLGVYLSVAAQAGRFLVEGRRSGLLELLLVTPLQAGELIRGQWRGILRLLGLPLLVCLSSHLLSTFLSQQEMQRLWSNMPATPAPASATTPASGSGTTTNVTTNTTTYAFSGRVYVTASTGGGAGPTPLWIRALPWLTTPLVFFTTVGNLAAMIWFGMWMGLTSKNTSSSTLKTLLFVQVVPWFVISFLSGLVMPLLMMASGTMRSSLGGTTPPSMLLIVLSPIVLASALAIGKDIGFVLWARRKLLAQFREKIVALDTLPMGLVQPAPPPIRQPQLPPPLPPTSCN